MIDAKALEAAIGAVAELGGFKSRTFPENIAKAAVEAYLAAERERGFVMVRAEPVRGASMAEWRQNLSASLFNAGDVVLAWANEGDLAMIAAAKEGE